MYHHFDWGPLPDERIEETPDAHVLNSVSAFLASTPTRPFFCAAGFYKPHLPWHAPQRFFDLYDVNRIALPLVKHDDLEDVPPIGREWALSPRDHELVTSRQQWPQAVQGYLAAISYVDDLIGKLVEVLDHTGLSDSTAIILWGDNGFHLGEKLHWRKFALWEEATRVPLIIVPPGARRGVVNRTYDPVSLIDIFPTIVEMANLGDVAQTDAFSLAPLISDPSKKRPSPVVMTWGRGNHSIRHAQWRYTRYSDGNEELYDRVADPYEWTNLASEPTLEAVTDSLKSYLPSDQPGT